MRCAWRRCGAKAIDRRSATSSFRFFRTLWGLGPEVWRVLDKAHGLRNSGEYEGAFDLDERIVTDLVVACRAVAAKVELLATLA
jgi:hypothetical protein